MKVKLKSFKDIPCSPIDGIKIMVTDLDNRVFVSENGEWVPEINSNSIPQKNNAPHG